MKQLLTILLFLPLFISCSSDDDSEETVKTTVIEIKSEAQVDQNYVLAYKDNNGYKQISTFFLRSGKKNNLSIENLSDSKLYIFTDFAAFSQNGKNYWRRIDVEYNIKKNESNQIEIPVLSINNTVAVDINDSSQFPKD